MSGKKLKTVKELIKEKSTKTGDKLTRKGKVERKLLIFNKLEVYVSEDTWKALKEIEKKGNVGWEKAIAFMLDAGTIIYKSMAKKITTQLQEIKKAEKNASDTGKTRS